MTWDCLLLDLCLHKSGMVANFRLRILYNVLVWMTLVVCGLVTWHTKGFLSKLPARVSPDIQYRGVRHNFSEHPICQRSNRGLLNESVMNFGVEWKIFREPCYVPCLWKESTFYNQQIVMDSCVPPEALAAVHSYNDIFLPTSVTRYYSEGVIHEKFFPFSEEMRFDLSYTYFVGSEPAWFFGTNPKRKPTHAVSVSGNHQKATTVLLDASGGIYKIFDKLTPIHISMRELITLAQGTPLTLRHGEHLPTGVLRTGITIAVEVKCFNHAVDLGYLKSFNGYQKVKQKVMPSTQQPACIMSFIKVSDVGRRNSGQTMWKSSDLNITGNRPIFEQLGGIQLQANDCYSIMRFPEVYNILLEITSLIVMLSLPSKALRLVLQHMLGKVSAAYRAILNEPISLSEAVVLWTVRTVAHMTLFTQLLGTVSNTHRSRHPSKILDSAATQTMTAASFQALLQTALADMENTDSKKIGNLVHFTMQAMLTESEEKQTILGKRPFKKLPQVTTSTPIGAQHFLSTCRSDADLPAYTMIELLDVDRRLGLGERFFFPRALWEAIYAASASNASFSEELERATLNQNDDSSIIKEWQQEVAAHQTESEESVAQLSVALKGAMQDIRNLRNDFDLAREEMRSAYQDLKHTRLELEHTKRELAKASRDESEMPNVPNVLARTINPENPMLPEISSISSLAHDCSKQIVPIGKEKDHKSTSVEKKDATGTSKYLAKSKSLPDAFAALARRRHANSPGSDDGTQDQCGQEYTELRQDVRDIELSLNARMDEVHFRCNILQEMVHDITNSAFPAGSIGETKQSSVSKSTESSSNDNRNVTASSSATQTRKRLGFTMVTISGEGDTNET